jgi:hypothetical protein
MPGNHFYPLLFTAGSDPTVLAVVYVVKASGTAGGAASKPALDPISSDHASKKG